jgi:hypothetical protein
LVFTSLLESDDIGNCPHQHCLLPSLLKDTFEAARTDDIPMIIVSVKIPPPPIPSTALKTINMIMLCDTEHPRAPIKNTTSDARRQGLRPNMSDRRPYIGCIAYMSARYLCLWVCGTME